MYCYSMYGSLVRQDDHNIPISEDSQFEYILKEVAKDNSKKIDHITKAFNNIVKYENEFGPKHSFYFSSLLSIIATIPPSTSIEKMKLKIAEIALQAKLSSTKDIPKPFEFIETLFNPTITNTIMEYVGQSARDLCLLAEAGALDITKIRADFSDNWFACTTAIIGLESLTPTINSVAMKVFMMILNGAAQINFFKHIDSSKQWVIDFYQKEAIHLHVKDLFIPDQFKPAEFVNAKAQHLFNFVNPSLDTSLSGPEFKNSKILVFDPKVFSLLNDPRFRRIEMASCETDPFKGIVNKQVLSLTVTIMTELGENFLKEMAVCFPNLRRLYVNWAAIKQKHINDLSMPNLELFANYRMQGLPDDSPVPELSKENFPKLKSKIFSKNPLEDGRTKENEMVYEEHFSNAPIDFDRMAEESKEDDEKPAKRHKSQKTSH